MVGNYVICHPKLYNKFFFRKLCELLVLYNSISSNGFFMFFRLLLLTWVYISVVFEDLCPNNSWIYLKSVPFSSKWVAKL